MKIFISYCHDDQAKVRSRVKELKKDLSQDIFWDQEIPGGANWREFLAKELTAASVLVVFVSTASAKSQHVLDEVALAVHRKVVQIIPVILEELNQEEMFSNPLLLAIRNIQAIIGYKLTVGDCCDQIREAARARPRADTGQCCVIAVMGVAGGVGKTTFVMAMSELIASTRHNVLLIDADYVADGLTSYVSSREFNQRHVRTVLDLLLETKAGHTLPDDMQTDFWDVTPPYLRKNAFGRIHLMPARFSGDNRRWPELDASTALGTMRWLVGNGKQSHGKYDCVIVDCGADTSHLVSASFVVCDYGFIVCRDQQAHIPKIERCRQFHRESYPSESIKAMNVIVNMASGESPPRWSGTPGASFLPYDPNVRKLVGQGNFDFEGVGLNAYYLTAAQTYGKYLSERHPNLVADEIRIWVKPYIEILQTFPDELLKRPRHRYLAWFSAIMLAVYLALGGSAAYLLYHYKGAALKVMTVRSLNAGSSVSPNEATRNLDGIKIPQELKDKVTMERGDLQIRGLLDAAEVKTLKNLSDSEPWKDAVVSGAALAGENVRSFEASAARNKGLCYFLLAVLPAAFFYRIYRHQVLAGRKKVLQELVKVRNAGDEVEVLRVLKRLLEENESARSQLAWVRDEFRRRHAEKRIL